MSKNHQSGAIVPMILVFMFFFLAMGVMTMSLISSNYQVAQSENLRLHAQLAADGGADRAIQRVNTITNWTGVNDETVMNADNIRTTFTASVVDDPDPNAGLKYVTVSGKAYAPAASTKARSERKYEIVLRGVGGGNYSVVTGVGGLVMLNSSKIVDGNVFVNGSITMSGTSQIGLSTKPVDVRAANQNCPNPADATYPRVCNTNESTQPISLSNSAHIYGSVMATNQTNGSGMTNNGLQSGSVAPLSMPPHDRQSIVNAVTASGNTMTGAAASCTTNGGSKTWNANTKIIGDVTVSHKCNIVVKGDVWITGALSFTQSSTMTVDNSLITPPSVMIDGKNGLDLNNSSIMVSNSAKIGFIVVTYWSAAACQPNCTDVTGVDLKNSQTTTTISIRNGAAGPNTEFYAKWSAANIGNSGNIGAVVGQTVNLNNSAAITFGTPVSGATAPSTWVVQSYRRLY